MVWGNLHEHKTPTFSGDSFLHDVILFVFLLFLGGIESSKSLKSKPDNVFLRRKRNIICSQIRCTVAINNPFRYPPRNPNETRSALTSTHFCVVMRVYSCVSLHYESVTAVDSERCRMQTRQNPFTQHLSVPGYYHRLHSCHSSYHCLLPQPCLY